MPEPDGRAEQPEPGGMRAEPEWGVTIELEKYHEGNEFPVSQSLRALIPGLGSVEVTCGVEQSEEALRIVLFATEIARKEA